jgi:hypothetical protein
MHAHQGQQSRESRPIRDFNKKRISDALARSIPHAPRVSVLFCGSSILKRAAFS